MTTADPTYSMADYVAVIRRRWVWPAMVVPAAILIAVFLAYVLEPTYRATATILLESASISEDLVQSTVASSATTQIELVQRRVMSTDALEGLVREFDPYPREKDLSTREKARRISSDTEIERVDPVTLEPVKESNAFSLHYHNSDPEIAAEVAERLAGLFLAYNQKRRQEAAEEASQFLSEQSRLVGQQMRKVDEQLSSMKIRYGDALPEAQNRNMQALDRAERDLDAAEREVRVVAEREQLLSLQLNQLSPNIMTTGGDATDLATLRAQLAEAEMKYTPDHPDVKRLRRSVASAVVAQASRGPSAAPDNPDYLRVQSQLQAARSELAALRAQADRARAQIAGYESSLRQMPVVEKDYVELVRRRDALLAQSKDIEAKLANATVAQSLEVEQRGERFSLIRAPYTPGSPYSPNRVGIILLGLLLGCGLAAAGIAVSESADQNVRGAHDATVLTGAVVLGAIPPILSADDRRQRFIKFGSVIAAYGIATIVVAVTVVRAIL